MAYTLDDIIFGAAFKGIGRGVKAGFNQFAKLSPKVAEATAEQLKGLSRYAKSLFVNSANIDKSSKGVGKLLNTKAQMEFVQKNLDDFGNTVVKQIETEADNLVKKGLFKSKAEAVSAINEDVLKAFQNKK